MKMRNIAALFAVLVLVFGMTACDKNFPNGPDGDNNVPMIDLNSDNDFVADPATDTYSLVDGTIDTPMELYNEFDPDDKGNGKKERKFDKFGRRHNGFYALHDIIVKLELTDEQKVTFREYLIAYRACVKEASAAVRDQYQAIMEAAREDRMDIMTQLRNSDITREEAKVLLEALNQSIRESLAQVDKTGLDEAKCACLLIFLNGFGTELDSDQFDMWTEWMAGLEGPCFEESVD